MIVNASENPKRFEEIIKYSDFLGQKIHADYISHQLKETNSFYVLENSAFMMSGTNITLCGNPSEDELEEILMFCNFCGIRSIESQIPGLPMNVDKVLHIMEHIADDEVISEEIIKNEDMYSFIKFCCSNFHGINFDVVYSNFTRKLNAGITNIYYLKKGDKIASGAITTLYSDDTVYITFVSTAPEFRKNGLAAQVIKHIGADNKGKKVILKCEDTLKSFYENLGFTEIGTVKLYKE